MAQDRTDDFLQIIRLSQRGRLKIYLGYAAGVGKTYAMLQEAHRLKIEGIDVVVGLVETHGRSETAELLKGLEIIPRRRQEYRGISMEEMDLDAVIVRRPHIVLVDEIAHTNVPGNRNNKRYEDVQDILAQGIHVISTLNIQHLESLYDIVERASGIKVTERLPDSILYEADQIVNVDVTTEDLNNRLNEGKIYPKDRIETAFANFFKKANLTQLRELALRELASQLDLKSRDDQEEHLGSTPDQIMVCLSSRGPNSEKLLRYASRVAGRLNRNWYAVYVQTSAEEPTVIDASIQSLLSDTLTLAKQLGAIVFTFKGEDIVSTILQFAKEYRVGHIIIGSPNKIPFWKMLIGKRSIAESLIRQARGVTVVVLDTQTSEPTLVPSVEESIAHKPATSYDTLQGKGPMALSTFVAQQGIVIWDEPVERHLVLQVLTDAAARCTTHNHQRLKYLSAILEREDQGSTFFNEGVAFPHARIAGIERACVAIGLTHRGVSDIATESPIDVVFLILSPQENPDLQIRILSLASKAAQDRQLMERLRKASSSEEVIEAIHGWEFSQVNKEYE
ncbi:MAG: PTS sugar transporter subunit IIA [Deltaproteobacteria bacterium]|nr:PTS sugar transporter subunit IIA [Deltaproteobacteria bacterium]